MTTKDAHKKSVVTTTPPELVSSLSSGATFTPSEFNSAVFDKGREVLVEKALRCPCTELATGQGLSTCQNCGGTGWLWINKKSTVFVITSINRSTKFSNWTETDRGTINITARAIDRLSFMDRVTLTDVISIFSQNLRFKEVGSKLFAYTVYYPLLVSDAYLYLADNKPLQPLELLTDYTIEENKIVLNDKYKNLNQDQLSVTVRYSHFPQYNIVDIPRETSVIKKKDCAEVDVLNNLPMNAIARKVHYVMDAPNFGGDSLFDNSHFDPNSITNILETLDPTSLLFSIVRSSSQQILDALNEEGNTNKNTEIKNGLP